MNIPCRACGIPIWKCWFYRLLFVVAGWLLLVILVSR